MSHDEALESDLYDAIQREMLLAIGRAGAGPARRLLGPRLRPPPERFARLMAVVASDIPFLIIERAKALLDAHMAALPRPAASP